MKIVSCVAAAAILALGTGTSHAQDPPFDSAIDVQLFEYSIGPRTFLTVNDADVSNAKQISADFLVTFLTNPFTVYTLDGMDGDIISERSEVVSSLVAGQLSGAYGINSKMQIGVSLPLVLSISGDGIDPSTGFPDAMSGIQATGLGDMLAEFKMKLWENDKGLRAGALAGITLPTSFGAGGSAFLGDNLPAARIKGLIQWSNGPISAGANLGIIIRKPRDLYSSTIGPQLLYGASGAYRITNKFAVVAEFYGRAGFDFEGNSSPVEAVGGFRMQATRDISVLAGGGAGLLSGIGSPGLRVFASVGWSRDVRDDDGDGLPNLRDKCPLLPEDKDDFEDNDGCPDPDNDGDRREDSVDQCPLKKEDIDGFQDEDGCPEFDNDKDGLPDIKDKCPNDAEDGISLGALATDGCPGSKTDSDFDEVMDNVDQCLDKEEDMDGFEDWDGCPEPDNDKDGILDDDDKCKVCAEDKDGFEDEDGCPEADNDGDGILDAQDRCPNQAEVFNGKDDEDGCPDKGRSRAKASLQGKLIVTAKPIQFKRTRLRSSGKKVIKEVAKVMKAHPEVTEWLILVAPPRGNDEEAARANGKIMANKIKGNLMKAGIASDRLIVLGSAADKLTIGIRAKSFADQGGGDGEFVCPAPFQVQEREPSDEPPPAPAAPADGAAGDGAAGDAKPADAAAGDAKPADAAAGDAKPADGAAGDAAAGDAKPADGAAGDAKPADGAAGDAKPADGAPADAKPPAPTPTPAPAG